MLYLGKQVFDRAVKALQKSEIEPNKNSKFRENMNCNDTSQFALKSDGDFESKKNQVRPYLLYNRLGKFEWDKFLFEGHICKHNKSCDMRSVLWKCGKDDWYKFSISKSINTKNFQDLIFGMNFSHNKQGRLKFREVAALYFFSSGKITPIVSKYATAEYAIDIKDQPGRSKLHDYR